MNNYLFFVSIMGGSFMIAKPITGQRRKGWTQLRKKSNGVSGWGQKNWGRRTVVTVTQEVAEPAGLGQRQQKPPPYGYQRKETGGEETRTASSENPKSTNSPNKEGNNEESISFHLGGVNPKVKKEFSRKRKTL
jgi:hypothetical protein